MYRGPVFIKTRKNHHAYILQTEYTCSHSTSTTNKTIWSVPSKLHVNYLISLSACLQMQVDRELGKHGIKASRYLLSSFHVGPAIIWRSKQQTKAKINKIVSRAKQFVVLSQVVYQYLRSYSPAQPVPWTPARQLLNNNRWRTCLSKLCFGEGILAAITHTHDANTSCCLQRTLEQWTEAVPYVSNSNHSPMYDMT